MGNWAATRSCSSCIMVKIQAVEEVRSADESEDIFERLAHRLPFNGPGLAGHQGGVGAISIGNMPADAEPAAFLHREHNLVREL